MSVEVLLKALGFIGLVLAAGGGVHSRWLAPGPSPEVRHRIRLGVWAGATMIAGASLAEALRTAYLLYFHLDAELVWLYLTETRPGLATLARIALATGLAILGAGPARPRRRDRALHGFMVAALAATFSWTSHSGASGSPWLVAVDLTHLNFAAVWAGGLVYLSWLAGWPAAPAVQRAAATTSRLGALSIALVAGTGLALALTHLWGLPALTGTAYGYGLIAKLAVFAVVIALAGRNHWVHLPAALAGGSASGLIRSVRAESLALMAIVGLTALIVSQGVPQPPPRLAAVVTFQGEAGSWRLRGAMRPLSAGGLEFQVEVTDATGAPAPESLRVEVVFDMLDHPMLPVALTPEAMGEGRYRGEAQLTMAGAWRANVWVGGQVTPVELRAR